MNKDQVKGRTNTVTGKIKETVGKATDDKDLGGEGHGRKGRRQSSLGVRRRQK